MKKVLSVLLAAIMLLAVLPAASFAENEVIQKNTVIDEVAVKIAEPFAGEELTTDAEALTENVAVTEVKWFDVFEGDYIETPFTFVEDSEYASYVTVTADEGYTFSTETVVTVNDYVAKVKLAEDNKSLAASISQISYVKPEPVEISECVVDVVAPVEGEPVLEDYICYSIDADIESIEWYNAETDTVYTETSFKAGTYYVKIVIAPCGENYFAEQVNIIINENSAKVEKNEDGTITATAEFVCEGTDSPFSFLKNIINVITTAFITFIRFLGSFIGLK